MHAATLSTLGRCFWYFILWMASCSQLSHAAPLSSCSKYFYRHGNIFWTQLLMENFEMLLLNTFVLSQNQKKHLQMKTTAEKQFQNLQKDILCWFNIAVKYCNSRWKTFKYEIISFWFIKVPEKHLYLAVAASASWQLRYCRIKLQNNCL